MMTTAVAATAHANKNVAKGVCIVILQGLCKNNYVTLLLERLGLGLGLERLGLGLERLSILRSWLLSLLLRGFWLLLLRLLHWLLHFRLRLCLSALGGVIAHNVLCFRSEESGDGDHDRHDQDSHGGPPQNTGYCIICESVFARDLVDHIQNHYRVHHDEDAAQRNDQDGVFSEEVRERQRHNGEDNDQEDVQQVFDSFAAGLTHPVALA
jgi:hypothetical protein